MVTTKLLTAQDLWNLGDTAEYSELIDGELTEVVPPTAEHGFLQANIIVVLHQLVREQGLGRVYGDAGYVLRRNPDTVLGPDISFVATGRLPADKQGYATLAPDLVVEIISPGNSHAEIMRKLAIYLAAGVRMIWIVYPRDRRVAVHVPGSPVLILERDDLLTGGDVLPGLSIRVAELFQD